jgi:hypothetical protein
MMMHIRGVLVVFALALFTLTLLPAQQPMPQTTTEKIPGKTSVTTQKLSGRVVNVDGNELLVRLLGGELRTFHVPDSRIFVVDGKELSVHELKPNSTLTATVTTTTTPVTERTTTVGSGKVWHVAGNTVILTLPNNENRMYKVQESYRFMVDGQPATVHDLRKGMVVSAVKIVESPKTEIASNTTVIGHGPPQPKPSEMPTEAQLRPAAVPAAAPTAAAAAEPAPAPAATESNPATALPSTASPIPLIGLMGLLFAAAAFGVRRVRRSF